MLIKQFEREMRSDAITLLSSLKTKLGTIVRSSSKTNSKSAWVVALLVYDTYFSCHMSYRFLGRASTKLCNNLFIRAIRFWTINLDNLFSGYEVIWIRAFNPLIWIVEILIFVYWRMKLLTSARTKPFINWCLPPNCQLDSWIVDLTSTIP